MNYKLIYDTIIERAKDRKLIGYSEKHHIIPKCIKGTDDVDNLINLTAKEHFICHYILVKIYKNNTSLLFAFNSMTRDAHGNRYVSRSYQIARSLLSNQLKKERKGTWTVGKDNGMYKKSIYAIWVEKYGIEWADNRMVEYSEKMKKSKTGRDNGFYGKKHTEKTKQHLREKKLKTYKVISPNNDVYILKMTPNEIADKFDLHRAHFRRYLNFGEIPMPKTRICDAKLRTVGWKLNTWDEVKGNNKK